MKRHQILGKPLSESLEVTPQLLAKDEDQIASAQAHAFNRSLLIDYAVMYAVFEHLGYGPIEGLLARLERGVDMAVEFFFGQWWVLEEDARSLDKSRPDLVRGVWLPLLPNVWLLAGLTGRWNDAAKICSWFDASVETECFDGMQDDDYMYLCIASSLRPEPMRGIDNLLGKWKATRQKHLRLLCAAWEAAIARDQKAFDKALKESVAHFLKVDARDVPNVNFWVALHPSLVWLIAERNGLKFPTLPEQIDAAIVRRQTIGLAVGG